MRPLIILTLFSIFILACHTPDHNGGAKRETKALMPSKPVVTDCDTSKWYLTKSDRDSVLIYHEDSYKSYYKKGELKRILRSYHELQEQISPDQAYEKRGRDGIAPCDPHLFGCEVCQDTYYILYAYFLKQKNGEKEYREERKNLIKIYRAINSIYGRLAQGGTYFTHQDSRILGYAEYAIYLKKSDTYNDTYNKQYDIAQQKKLYLNELRQIIIDEVDHNNDIYRTEKSTLKAELFKTVQDIDGLVNNYFYLKMVREFQYSNY